MVEESRDANDSVWLLYLYMTRGEGKWTVGWEELSSDRQLEKVYNVKSVLDNDFF